jgi:putative transposase
MVFINVATRRVWISTATRNPTEAWVVEQAKSFIDHAEANELKLEMVTRDNDQIYKKGFDAVMEGAGIRAKRLALRSPNTNAYVERFIQTIQVECLDHFLVFGKKHFDYLDHEYVEHYHNERPHQGLNNQVVRGEPPPEQFCPPNAIVCRTRLAGLLKHYYRAAA